MPCLPPVITIFIGGIWLPFPVMGGLWHCFTHMFFSLHGVSKISHGKKFQNGLTQGFLAGLDQSRLREPDNFFERCIDSTLRCLVASFWHRLNKLHWPIPRMDFRNILHDTRQKYFFCVISPWKIGRFCIQPTQHWQRAVTTTDLASGQVDHV